MSKLTDYRRHYGWLGLAQILANRVCGRPTIMTAFPPTLDHGVRLRLHTSDTMVFHCVFVAEEYRFGLPSSSPRVIVDAGANIGLSAIFYAQRFPQARIIAVEAQQSNYELMCANVRRYPNIFPLHGALWGTDGSIALGTEMLRGASGHWGYTVNPVPGPIRAYTIPSLMQAFQLEHIDLLKIDIEGAEQEVFETCDWQDRVASVVIELHERFKPGCAAPVERALRGFHRTTAGDLTWYRR